MVRVVAARDGDLLDDGDDAARALRDAVRRLDAEATARLLAHDARDPNVAVAHGAADKPSGSRVAVLPKRVRDALTRHVHGTLASWTLRRLERALGASTDALVAAPARDGRRAPDPALAAARLAGHAAATANHADAVALARGEKPPCAPLVAVLCALIEAGGSAFDDAESDPAGTARARSDRAAQWQRLGAAAPEVEAAFARGRETRLARRVLVARAFSRHRAGGAVRRALVGAVMDFSPLAGNARGADGGYERFALRVTARKAALSRRQFGPDGRGATGDAAIRAPETRPECSVS